VDHLLRQVREGGVDAESGEVFGYSHVLVVPLVFRRAGGPLNSQHGFDLPLQVRFLSFWFAEPFDVVIYKSLELHLERILYVLFQLIESSTLSDSAGDFRYFCPEAALIPIVYSDFEFHICLTRAIRQTRR
jgi:hypothetical protein